MKTKLILAIISVSVLVSWTPQQNEINNLEWLIGTWETKTSRGNLYESWIKISETEFQAKSYYLNKQDTLLLESVQLVEKEKKLHYIVSVKNNNNELPIDFVSKPIQDPAVVVFENLQHDFPKVITYKKVGKDSLFAEISGSVNENWQNRLFR